VLALAALVAAGCPRRTPAPVPEPAQPPIAGAPLSPPGSRPFHVAAVGR
jgi:hypothetical protein